MGLVDRWLGALGLEDLTAGKAVAGIVVFNGMLWTQYSVMLAVALRMGFGWRFMNSPAATQWRAGLRDKSPFYSKVEGFVGRQSDRVRGTRVATWIQRVTKQSPEKVVVGLVETSLVYNMMLPGLLTINAKWTKKILLPKEEPKEEEPPASPDA